MRENKILDSIEEGLLEYYISLDYTLKTKVISTESRGFPDVNDHKYDKLAKSIMFRAKLEARKALQAKVISLSETSEQLVMLDKEMEGKVFSIFKKHVEEFGLAANYRNFEAMTEDEMSEILKQVNHTALLDDIISQLDDE